MGDKANRSHFIKESQGFKTDRACHSIFSKFESFCRTVRLQISVPVGGGEQRLFSATKDHPTMVQHSVNRDLDGVGDQEIEQDPPPNNQHQLPGKRGPIVAVLSLTPAGIISPRRTRTTSQVTSPRAGTSSHRRLRWILGLKASFSLSRATAFSAFCLCPNPTPALSSNISLILRFCHQPRDTKSLAQKNRG